MKKNIQKLIILFSYICLPVVSMADDTDIINLSQDADQSNILFILDLSRSMRFEMNDGNGGTQTRYKAISNSLQAALNDPDLSNLNVGISSFAGDLLANLPNPIKNKLNHDWANGIAYPISPLESKAQVILNQNPLFNHQGSNSYLPPASASTLTKDYISQSILGTWEPIQRTPIVDSLYEAALYFSGGPVHWGDYSPTKFRSAHPSTYTGSFGGAINYISPIGECSSNSIVLLTDGRPKRNFSKNLIQTMIGKNCTIPTAKADGECGPDIAKYLATTDLNTTMPNKQTVNTSAVGIDLGPSAQAYLEQITNSGNGVFINAVTGNELTSALKQIIKKTVKQASSFTSPTYTPDKSSFISHDSYVYLPVFAKDSKNVWSGNLKKFKHVDGRLIDKNNKDVTNNLGVMNPEVEDFWALEKTTDLITSGGAAKKLNSYISRNVYTDVANKYNISQNPLSISNNNISKSLLGNSNITNTYRNELISFIRGKKSTGVNRFHMGDIIHSKPVVISYPNGESTVFVGTNEGYLHAFDTKDGYERFAYMPSELLKNIDKQYTNTSSTHTYGIDGPMTLLHDDINNNNIVDGSEKAILYFGLRRGGKAYYALDITKLNQPRLLWKKTNNSSGFSNLGYTWSKPTLSKMTYKKNSVTMENRDVLIFGGGYINDNAGESDLSATASDVYIVDAVDGYVIWKTNPTDISYTVPGSIRAIDLDADGLLDRLYFSDTGGSIWRLKKISNKSTKSTSFDLTEFAYLGAKSLKRAFFNEPDVTISKYNGSYIITIAIGSGMRPTPLVTDNQDRFYLLIDKDISTGTSTSYATLLHSDLKDVTSGPKKDLLSSMKGWYIDLKNANGEKSLSNALSYRGMVLFSTVAPDSSSLDPKNTCENNSLVTSYFYALDILSGAPVLDFNGDGNVGTMEKSTKIGVGTIPETPQIIYNQLKSSKGEECTASDCVRPTEIVTGSGAAIKIKGSGSISHKIDTLSLDELHRTFWYNK